MECYKEVILNEKYTSQKLEIKDFHLRRHPLPMPQINSHTATCNLQVGATLVEYTLVLLLFGMILLGATSFFESSSERFYESSTGGLLVPYPPNYIPAPAPTAATPQLQ